ncbi:MAG: sugar ABC transporter permease [Phycisphaeraceae bacterium]|nr:MAG: sugar ABC transporter permease [Phycisphaeraceae bacterium]
MSAGREHHRLAPLAFLAPAVVVLGVFFAWGFARVAWYSLTDTSAFSGGDFVGADNYRRLLTTGLFVACLINSVAYLAVTPLIAGVALVAAMCVASEVKGSRWLRAVFFLPVVTPTIVAALAWRALYDENDGLLNTALEWFGLGPVGWLSERPWTLISAMLVTLWKGFGFYMLVLLGALLAVPREQREAAALDGASRWGVFRHVVLPSIRPALVLVMVVSAISALKVFDEVFVTIRGAPLEHQTVVPLVYELAFEQGRFGLASAAGCVLFVVVLGLSLLNLWLGRGDGQGRPRGVSGGKAR